LEIFYGYNQDPLYLFSMSTIYLKSFGADLSENGLFTCVSILFAGTSTVLYSTELQLDALCVVPWLRGSHAFFVPRREISDGVVSQAPMSDSTDHFWRVIGDFNFAGRV
jgi:hypothetical protein